MVVCITQFIVVLLVSGCTKSQATVTYQPSDKKIEAGQTLQWSFDIDQIGGLPVGAKVFSGKWAVRAEAGTPSLPNALCQTGTDLYPALTLSDKIFADIGVSTRFKPISGKTDRAAGIIFRIQDKNNYYILRANALEDNVILFKYVGGIRSEIKEGSFKVPSGKWQELRVEAVGNTIRGYLDDNLVVETHDNTFKAGKVGLWTKADSVTCFDDVKANAK